MKKILTFFFMTQAMFAQQISPCDLNNDGGVTILDYQLVVNMMALGKTTCTANINGQGVCNFVTVQRIIKAAFTGTCDVSNGSHYVKLDWTASTSTNVSGYNVYRSTLSGGPYTKVNSTLVSGVYYLDTSIQAGMTYYYVCTAVDDTDAESVYSNEAMAQVPSP